jgi:hypothetical protein
MPGSITWLLATLIASLATTKNQPPDTDIIMFQMSCGMAKGTSSCQKLCQADKWYIRAASRRSWGTALKD